MDEDDDPFKPFYDDKRATREAKQRAQDLKNNGPSRVLREQAREQAREQERIANALAAHKDYDAHKSGRLVVPIRTPLPPRPRPNPGGAEAEAGHINPLFKERAERVRREEAERVRREEAERVRREEAAAAEAAAAAPAAASAAASARRDQEAIRARTEAAETEAAEAEAISKMTLPWRMLSLAQSRLRKGRAQESPQESPQDIAISNFRSSHDCDVPMFRINGKRELTPRQLINLCTPREATMGRYHNHYDIHDVYRATPGAEVINKGENFLLDDVLRKSIPIKEVSRAGIDGPAIIKGWLHTRTAFNLPPLEYLDSIRQRNMPITDAVIDTEFTNYCSGDHWPGNRYKRWESLVSLIEQMPPLWRALMCDNSIATSINYGDMGHSQAKSCADGFVERVIISIGSSGRELFPGVDIPMVVVTAADAAAAADLAALTPDEKRDFLRVKLSETDGIIEAYDNAHPGNGNRNPLSGFRPLLEEAIRARSTENNPDNWNEEIVSVLLELGLGGDYDATKGGKYTRKSKRKLTRKSKRKSTHKSTRKFVY